MNQLTLMLNKFAKLQLRERLLVLAALAALLYFIVDITLLIPQQKKIAKLQQLDIAHKAELASVNKALTEIGKDMSIVTDQQGKDRATLDELNKQIADAEAFFAKADAATSQLGELVKELLNASPNLKLVSLSTLPTTPFYMRENKAGGGEKAMAIYKNGVAVSIKGDYMALLAYMESLQKYPRRLFWAEAKLDVAAYPEAMLKLVIYSLSDQASPALR